MKKMLFALALVLPLYGCGESPEAAYDRRFEDG
jgi:hypothetical protein